LEEFEEYGSRLGRHTELIESLREDWGRAVELLEIEDWFLAVDELEIEDWDQFCRRTLVRTLFAMIEGSVFALKQLILEEHRIIGKIELSPAQYAILSEEKYDLEESGVLRTLNTHPKLESNIKFTLPFYAHALGMSFEFDPPLGEEPGWGSLCQAHKKRNRLMHPKSQDDLTVSDGDLDDTLSAASWFIEQLDRLESMAFEALKQLLSQAETGTLGGTVESDSAAEETA